jgi:glucose/arabinose dehydrogenase
VAGASNFTARLALALALASCGFVRLEAADGPELHYSKKETREASQKAALAAHPNPSPELKALLEDRLDDDFPRTAEDRYYSMVTFNLPAGVQLEPGALEWMPDGKLAISTRVGDIWMVDAPMEKPPIHARWTLYASGLHEVLGLAYRDGWLYATQRGEVSRLKDTNGDGRADVFETVNDDWGIGGDYHEYAFGSKFDREGNLWVVLCLTGSFTSENPYRGWCLRITPDGKSIPTCSGIRSPGGIGMNAAGDMFYTDNQGPWNGACALKHLVPGDFMGNPEGNKWYTLATNLGPRIVSPKSGSRMMVEAKKIPQLRPPAVYFPYPKMGQSASGFIADLSAGKFGPFREQLFVGDQTHSTLMRVYLEKVQDHYQGACFPFREGFASGCLSVLQAKDGSLFVGGTDRGWGARGGKPFALQRLLWRGATPFEIHEMHAKPDGFELTFTEPVDPAAAGSPASYTIETYTYIYQSSYGSPEVDKTKPTITSVKVAPDGRSVRLKIDGLQEGHVHELHLPGVRSAKGQPLLHPAAYYTLNYFARE